MLGLRFGETRLGEDFRVLITLYYNYLFAFDLAGVLLRAGTAFLSVFSALSRKDAPSKHAVSVQQISEWCLIDT